MEEFRFFGEEKVAFEVKSLQSLHELTNPAGKFANSDICMRAMYIVHPSGSYLFIWIFFWKNIFAIAKI